MDFDAMIIRHLQHEIIEGQIRLCQHSRFEPAPNTGQLTVPTTIALRARLKTTRLTFQNHHVVDEFDRNPELRRRRPV